MHYAMLWNFLLSPSFCLLENSTSLQFFSFLIHTFLLFRKHFTSPTFLSKGGGSLRAACRFLSLVTWAKLSVNKGSQDIGGTEKPLANKVSQWGSIFSCQYCTAPEMIPTPKWSPTLEWSQIDPEMIPTFLLVDPEMIPKELGNVN